MLPVLRCAHIKLRLCDTNLIDESMNNVKQLRKRLPIKNFRIALNKRKKFQMERGMAHSHVQQL